MQLAIDNTARQSDPQKDLAVRLGAFYLWQLQRGPNDPEWDDLSGMQQAHIRAAFRFANKAISRTFLKRHAS